MRGLGLLDGLLEFLVGVLLHGLRLLELFDKFHLNFFHAGNLGLRRHASSFLIVSAVNVRGTHIILPLLFLLGELVACFSLSNSNILVLLSVFSRNVVGKVPDVLLTLGGLHLRALGIHSLVHVDLVLELLGGLGTGFGLGVVLHGFLALTLLLHHQIVVFLKVELC